MQSAMKSASKRTPGSEQRPKLPVRWVSGGKPVTSVRKLPEMKPTQRERESPVDSSPASTASGAYDMLSEYIDNFESEESNLVSRRLWVEEKQRLERTDVEPYLQQANLTNELEYFINKVEQLRRVRLHQLRQLQLSLLADLDWDREFNSVAVSANVQPSALTDDEYHSLLFGTDADCQPETSNQERIRDAVANRPVDVIHQNATTPWNEFDESMNLGILQLKSTSALRQLTRSMERLVTDAAQRPVQTSLDVPAARELLQETSSTRLLSLDDHDDEANSIAMYSEAAALRPKQSRSPSRDRRSAASSSVSSTSSSTRGLGARRLETNLTTGSKLDSSDDERVLVQTARRPPAARTTLPHLQPSQQTTQATGRRRHHPQSPSGLLLGISAIERFSDSDGDSQPQSIDPIDSFLSTRRSMSQDSQQQHTQLATHVLQPALEDEFDLLALARENIDTFAFAQQPAAETNPFRSPEPKTPTSKPTFT